MRVVSLAAVGARPERAAPAQPDAVLVRRIARLEMAAAARIARAEERTGRRRPLPQRLHGGAAGPARRAGVRHLGAAARVGRTPAEALAWGLLHRFGHVPGTGSRARRWRRHWCRRSSKIDR